MLPTLFGVVGTDSGWRKSPIGRASTGSGQKTKPAGQQGQQGSKANKAVKPACFVLCPLLALALPSGLFYQLTHLEQSAFLRYLWSLASIFHARLIPVVKQPMENLT
jgi:hypothetical protein